MKQLSVFILLIVLSLGIDLHPVDLEKERNQSIHVEVGGEAQKPGTYELSVYATIQDLLEQCGTTEEADLSGLNPSTILSNHDVLNIPKRKEEEEAPLVSINSAGLEALCTLPGIGESTASRIISYRNENGLFQKKEDLMNVKGIGEKSFARLESLITL